RAGVLELVDTRSEIRQNERRQWPGKKAREIEHLDASERCQREPRITASAASAELLVREELLQLHREQLVARNFQLPSKEELYAVGLRILDELLEVLGRNRHGAVCSRIRSRLA